MHVSTCRDEESDSDDEGKGKKWRKRSRDGGSGLFDEDFFEGEFRKRRRVSKQLVSLHSLQTSH